MQQHNIKWGLFFFALMINSTLLLSQIKENDPYTILGLGNIEDVNFASLSAMPGLSSTYHDAYSMNLQNPAASSYLAQTSFEAGGYYQFKTLKTATKTDRFHSGNLRYLALGFPLFNSLNKLNERKKRPYNLGMTISLTPYSTKGYDLTKKETIAGAGQVVSTFQGSGGTYKLQWGNSLRYDKLAVGFNLGYLFGKQKSKQEDTFADQSYEFANSFLNESRISGIVWNAGLMYDYILPQKEEFDNKGKKIKRPRTRVSFGLHGNSSNKVNIYTNSIYERVQTVISGNSTGTITDTMAITNEQKGKITLPAEIGAGIMLAKDLSWKVGINYIYTGWSNYANTKQPANLNNSFRIALGAEWIPNFAAPFRQYGKHITYRIGAFYEKDPRIVTGYDSWSKKAITFGMKLPLQPDLDNRKLVSSVSISAELGQYGNSDFVQQNYFKINLGFTLNDNLWFYKSKYN